MKKAIGFISFCIISLTLHAQPDRIAFFREFEKRMQEFSSYRVAENRTVDIEMAPMDAVQGWTYLPGDSLARDTTYHFVWRELDSLINKVRLQQGLAWKEKPIQDKIPLYPKDPVTGLTVIGQTSTPVDFSLTDPVFFRDGTFALFYYSYWCGSLCAERALCLYRKIGGTWRKVAYLTHTVS